MKLDEYVIKVNGEQIFKDYRTHVKTSKGEDHIFDVQFKKIFDDNNVLIAWCWYGLRTFQAVIDKDSSQRGLRLRKENIQIGDEDALQRLFKEDRGTHYFIGEIHVVSKELIPNSHRDYFNETPMRNTFEREIQAYFSDTLHRLYHAGNDFSSAVDKIDTYEKQVNNYNQKLKKGDFIDSNQREEAKAKIEKARKNAEDGKKKISAMLERNKADAESPITKVLNRIINERNIDRFIPTLEDGNSPISSGDATSKNGGKVKDLPQIKKQKNNDPKHWTDRLSSVSKNDRKVISKVIGVVNAFVDSATFERILDKIEEEFK